MDEIKDALSRYSLTDTTSEEVQRRTQQPSQIVSYDAFSERPKMSIVDKHILKVGRYMNSYRLESKRPFNVESVQVVLREVLTRDLAEAHYDPNTMTKLGVTLAGEIRSKVKQLNFDRYKLICLVQIVEKSQQSILSTAKFLWDVDRDRFAVYSLNNAHIAAMACVFGIYYE